MNDKFIAGNPAYSISYQTDCKVKEVTKNGYIITFHDAEKNKHRVEVSTEDLIKRELKG